MSYYGRSRGGGSNGGDHNNGGQWGQDRTYENRNPSRNHRNQNNFVNGVGDRRRQEGRCYDRGSDVHRSPSPKKSRYDDNRGEFAASAAGGGDRRRQEGRYNNHPRNDYKQIQERNSYPYKDISMEEFHALSREDQILAMVRIESILERCISAYPNKISPFVSVSKLLSFMSFIT